MAAAWRVPVGLETPHHPASFRIAVLLRKAIPPQPIDNATIHDLHACCGTRSGTKTENDVYIKLCRSCRKVTLTLLSFTQYTFR
jgi:hypothetical protein